MSTKGGCPLCDGPMTVYIGSFGRYFKCQLCFCYWEGQTFEVPSVEELQTHSAGFKPGDKVVYKQHRGVVKSWCPDWISAVLSLQKEYGHLVVEAVMFVGRSTVVIAGQGRLSWRFSSEHLEFYEEV